MRSRTVLCFSLAVVLPLLRCWGTGAGLSEGDSGPRNYTRPWVTRVTELRSTTSGGVLNTDLCAVLDDAVNQYLKTENYIRPWVTRGTEWRSTTRGGVLNTDLCAVLDDAVNQYLKTEVPIMAGTSVDEWVARVTPAYMVDVAKHRRRIRKKSRKPSRPLRLWTLLLQLLRLTLYLHYTKHTKEKRAVRRFIPFLCLVLLPTVLISAGYRAWMRKKVNKHRRRIRKKSLKPTRPLWLRTLLLQLLRFSVYLHYTKHTKEKRVVRRFIAFLCLVLLTTVLISTGYSALVREMLLMIAGDVERNPGPTITRLCPDDLITVFEELLEVSADWYDIGLTLKLKPGILDTIKGPFKEPKSCIRDMLKDWLETSPNPSWESIVAALRRPVVRKEALANRLEDKYCTPASELPTVVPKEALAEQLEDKHYTPASELPTDERLETFCSKVRAIYEGGLEVQTDCWPPAVHSSFVNVVLVKNDKSPYSDEHSRQTIQRTMDDTVEKNRKVSFEQLFSDIEPGARVLIEGRPGSGKTTLMNKLSREWAKRTILKNVKLLLHVPLRGFCNNPSLDLTHLTELFDPEGLPSSGRPGNLLTTGEGICIVLDGLDEYTHSSDRKNLVSKLMHRQCLPKAVVIATSRPAASRCFRECATKRAEVLGFLRHQIADYIKQHYEGAEQKATRLLAYLQSHQKIHRMCYLPVYLAMIVYLNDIFGHQSEHMPRTETDVYQLFTTNTLLRDQKKKAEDGKDEPGSLVKPEDLPPQQLDTFRRICKLAYQQTLLSQPIFTQSDAAGIITEETRLESLGLLTVDQQFTKYGVEETYSFLHLTFQEFLSACHISSLPSQQVVDCCKDYGDRSHMSVVWRFFCGITKLEKDHELEVFGMLVDSYGKENCMQLVHCSYESQNKKTARRIVSSTDGRLTIKYETMLSTDSIALSFVLNNSGECLTKLVLWECQLGVEEMKVLVDNTEELPRVKCLSFMFTVIRDEVRPSFVEFVKKFPCLEELDLRWCFIGDSGAVAFAPVLQSLTSLKTLDLAYNDLTDGSVECLTSLLGALKDLEELYVFRNKFSDYGKRQLRRAAEARKGLSGFTETQLYVF